MSQLDLVQSKPRPKHLLDQHAEELLAPLPEGWRISAYQVLSDGAFLLSGSIATIKQTGKNKGRPRWTSEHMRMIAIPAKAHQEWLTAWELRTGKCSHCNGTGKVLKSTGINGTIYTPCRDCGGTGSK